MTLAQLHSSINAKLTATIPELETLTFPSNPAEFTVNHPLGVILTHVLATQHNNTKLIFQKVDIVLEINLILMELNDESEAYPYIARIKQAFSDIFFNGKMFLPETTNYLWSEDNMSCFSLTFRLKDYQFTQGELL